MEIFQSNLEYIETESKSESERLENLLTYRITGYGDKEETLRLYNKLEPDLYEVPRYTHTVLETARAKIQIERDNFVSKKVKFPKFKLELRKEQRKAIKSYLKDRDNNILVLPPASGKTIMSAKIASELKEKTLILVHRGAFFKVWKDDIKKAFGIPAKDIGEIRGKKCTIGKQFTIATYQTLYGADYDVYNEFGLVINDETHHLSAETFNKVVCRFNAKHMMGVTGTYERTDGLHSIVNLYLGRIAYYKTDIDHKHIETANIYRLDTDITVPLAKGENIHHMYHKLLSHPDRWYLFLDVFEACHKAGRKQLIFTHSTTYAKLYSSMLNHMGYKTATMIGGDNPNEEKSKNLKIKQAMLDGKMDAIVATVQYLKEGESINIIDTLHFVTPITNKVDWFQSLARGQRQHEDKHSVLILDYVDNLLPRCMRYWQNRIEWSGQNNGHNYVMKPFTLDTLEELSRKK